ncbi:MAG: LysR family transcriptional regulator [Desulfamplus sp.]|nr:LysR family transcriptional regulator [Desulfamplus sp.]MBF0388790.1 LysR family transcriptional regulator [Desulfamplus sp.]
MTQNKKMFHARSKIWIEDDDGNVVFGLGRLKMLNAIKEHGSLLAASKALNMGYRAIWSRMKSTEKRLGASLLITQQGGRGGGSKLTPLAEALVEEFKKVSKNIENITDEEFAKALENYIPIKKG